MKRRDENEEAGFTLVEVAVAAGLMGVVLLGVFASLATAQHAETAARERQAASTAAFRQLDLAASTSDFDSILATWNGAAFHVPYGSATLPPARAPLNTGAEILFAGRIVVSEVDLDGDGTPEDFDGDGAADLLELRASCAWTSVDGSDAAFEAVTRRSR